MNPCEMTTDAGPPSSVVLTSHADRGERLYPKRSSRVYWHLTRLREEYESAIRDFLEPRDLRTLVDYGCGNMPYRPLLERHVERYVGCDFPGNELADRVITDPLKAPADAGSADCVLSSQVLEHALDPAAYLAECGRILTDNGILFLSTHGVWRYHPDPHDYWRWTSEGLRRQLTRAGFEILRFRGIMGPMAYGLQICQDALVPRLKYGIRKPVCYFAQRLIGFFDRRCPQAERDRDACVYLVVATKRGTPTD